MSKATPKNFLLFYSKSKCDHSKRCIDQLTKSGLIQHLILCNVDDPKLNIPNFIEYVPSLYIVHTKTILTNDDLFQWIQLNSTVVSKATTNNNVSMADITGDDSIFAFQHNEFSGSGCSAYSFIDDGQNELIPSNCEFLDRKNETLTMPKITRIDGQNGPPTTESINVNSDKNAGKDEISLAYSKMLEARKNDVMPQRIG